MANIPAIVKHMTLAILKKEGWSSSRVNFERALGIAISRCTQYGFVTGSGYDLSLTQKGKATKHENESKAKNKQFDAAFSLMSGGTKDKDGKKEIGKAIEHPGAKDPVERNPDAPGQRP